jgi:hypothetical protein
VNNNYPLQEQAIHELCSLSSSTAAALLQVIEKIPAPPSIAALCWSSKDAITSLSRFNFLSKEICLFFILLEI